MKKIMLFFAVACILVACNNEIELSNETQYVTEFKADFGGTDSRMVVTPDNGLKFDWEDGEYLYVVSIDDPTVIKYYKYNSATETFIMGASDDAMEEGKKYFAVNKYRKYNDLFDVEDGKIIFKTRLDKSKGVTKIPMISNVFTASATGTIASMHHTVGVVEVPVKLINGSPYNQLEKVGFFVSGGKISENFNATPESPYFKEAAEGGEDTAWSEENLITLNENTPVSFYVPMFPGTYTNPTLYYDFYTGIGSLYLTGTLTVECGKVTKMPTQEITIE